AASADGRDHLKLSAEAVGLRVAGRWLIRAASFTLAPGSVTVIVGPNGSGKTTLLRALLGLRPLDAGRVRPGERALDDWSARERARVCAWLPQRTDLPWSMPAEQLVMLERAPHLSTLAGPGPTDADAVASALARVGASALAARDVRTLSGGELQR